MDVMEDELDIFKCGPRSSKMRPLLGTDHSALEKGRLGRMVKTQQGLGKGQSRALRRAEVGTETCWREDGDSEGRGVCKMV